MKFKQLLIGWLFVLVCSNISAFDLKNTNLTKTLSLHTTWLNLLHYEQNDDTQSGYLSAIHSKSLFLDKQGSDDPHRELLATIEALSSPFSGEIDQAPYCRFPARLLWLRKKLGNDFAQQQDLNNCPKFSQWSYQDSVESISIIFASGYLGNPASFYGHTLLKFNSSKKLKRTSLQDASLNYGAIETKNDGAISYILKGLFGGYEASFSHIQYYFHDHNYGEAELRDMWEYELNLKPSDVKFLVAHSWEVLGQKYTYYCQMICPGLIRNQYCKPWRILNTKASHSSVG